MVSCLVLIDKGERVGESTKRLRTLWTFKADLVYERNCELLDHASEYA